MALSLRTHILIVSVAVVKTFPYLCLKLNKMSENLKIEEEELSKLKSLKSRLASLRDQIAEASVRHHALMAVYPSVESELYTYQNELNQKYGDIKIDMSTGEYSRNENEN